MWCFFYGVITRYALSGTIIFSLVDSYLITFKIGNIAKYSVPFHLLLIHWTMEVNLPGNNLLNIAFYQHILSCSYYSGFLPQGGRGRPLNLLAPLKRFCTCKFKILHPPPKKKKKEAPLFENTSRNL